MVFELISLPGNDDIRAAIDDALGDELRADGVATNSLHSDTAASEGKRGDKDAPQPPPSHRRELSGDDEHYQVADLEHLDVDGARGPGVREGRVSLQNEVVSVSLHYEVGCVRCGVERKQGRVLWGERKRNIGRREEHARC